MGKITEKNIKNFLNKVEKTNTCWLWRGGISARGYGNFAFRRSGKLINNRAHRFSYTIHKGKIPKGLLVCHKCDNTICVNPNHLFLGTHSDNVQDAIGKGRWNPVCGEKSATSKLTAEDVLKIRDMSSKGVCSQYEIAKLFNVARQTISSIIVRKNWKHI